MFYRFPIIRGNDMDKSTFLINMGRRIAKARKDVGLSQAFLAEKADISEIHMSNIERGKKNPSADVLCRISEILNISVDVILLPDIETSKRMLNDELENLLGDLTSYEREKIYSIINNIKQLMKKEK